MKKSVLATAERRCASPRTYLNDDDDDDDNLHNREEE